MLNKSEYKLNNLITFTESKLDAMFQILNAFCSIQTERNFQAANRFINIFLLEFNHSGQIASLLLQVKHLDFYVNDLINQESNNG